MKNTKKNRNSIQIKKLFIGGFNMSGKGQLIQFLNSHPKIVIFPFHKFGISYDINNFINFLIIIKSIILKMNIHF